MKMSNYLPLINKGQVKLRLVAESWGWSDCVPCFLCLLNDDDLGVKGVKGGFGHTVMSAGRNPRTIDITAKRALEMAGPNHLIL